MSIRRFAAVVGLLLFAAHTLAIPLCRFFTIIRTYSAIARLALPWDSLVPTVSPETLQQLNDLADVIIRNEPVPIRIPIAPPVSLSAYDAVGFVDASASGWGALVSMPNGIFALQQRWDRLMNASASAEPRAALLLLRWILRGLASISAPKICIVTDHSPIVTGQAHWVTGHRGFSSSYHLNNLFSEAASVDGLVAFFHIDGVKNPADALSRSVPSHTRLVTRAETAVLPALETCAHPYLMDDRPEYMV